jgi:hypothetical protein
MLATLMPPLNTFSAAAAARYATPMMPPDCRQRAPIFQYFRLSRRFRHERHISQRAERRH